MGPRLWTGLFDFANAAGRWLAHWVGEPVSLDPEAVLAEAFRQAGCDPQALDRLPEDGLEEGLRRFLSAADREAELTPVGRLATRRDATRLLASRLRLGRDRGEHPGIAEERIEAPVFIVGLPRTGTTLLHGLLAADPASRAPATWEVMEPSPPPGSEGDPRRVPRTRRQLRWFDRLAPDYRVAHPLEAELPQECMEVLCHVFQSDRFFRTHHVPSYRDWLDGRPADEAYAFHRRFLQHLQWGGAGTQWVLKSPPHTFALDALVRTYPDARFIQIHRDPVTAMASFVSHTRRLRVAFSARPDLLRAGPVLERWAEGLERLLDFREREAVPAGRWVDLSYEALAAEPLAGVERVYAGLGWGLKPEARRAMERFLAAHPQHKHGVHRYRPEAYGMDREREGERFGRYRRAFTELLARGGRGP